MTGHMPRKLPQVCWLLWRRMVIILDLAILGSMAPFGNPAQLTAADTKPANGALATQSAPQVLC